MNSYAVEVKNLDVQFGNFYAVKNVSFSVKPGEIFGFLGANGAGKTTTIRVLCGILSPTRGEVHVAGQEFRSAGTALKMKVGYMSQKFTLYDDLTVNENLKFAGELHRMDLRKADFRRQELLEFIGWHRSMDTLVKDLPGGQKQQISLVAAMMHDPEILFLDEPTAGVSPMARSRFWALIRGLSSRGKTVFVTTHYMDEAENCQRIALMRGGELVALDSPHHLKQNIFPRGLIEFTPHNHIPYEDILALKQKHIFSLFEPYGLRYHLEWNDEVTAQEYNEWLHTYGDCKLITPSLEDVFMRIVEGKNR